MVRNESIDVIKGTLIFLVIIGHILLGSLDNNGLRYFIYSFHMPIFFFLSGYLLNLQKISKNTAIVLLRKYWKRMLLQWIIALLVYSLIISYSNFTLYEIVSQPYLHLF